MCIVFLLIETFGLRLLFLLIERFGFLTNPTSVSVVCEIERFGFLSNPTRVSVIPDD